MRRDAAMSRRDLLRGLGAAALAGCAPRARAAAPRADRGQEALAAARAAAAYLASLEVETEHGLVWRKSADRADHLTTDLYHGSAGPTLFLLELHRATGDEAHLDRAVRGGRHLVDEVRREPSWQRAGLYGGLAGQGVVLRALAETTGDAAFRDAAAHTIGALDAAVFPYVGGGFTYGGVNDVYYGNAGVIAWLVEAGPAFDDDRALDLAIRLGDGLLALAEETPAGRRWRAYYNADDELPGFSHGTAGVAFALARLYEVTRHERFLAAALDGARHVTSLAYTDGDVCLLPHALPDGEDRYYLGLCHGPVGTWRMFEQLHRVTGDATWAEWRRKAIRGVTTSGVPYTQTPGFWDNVGQCCGNAAIAEWMLTLHEETGDEAHLAFARELVADVLARATPAAGGGLEWIHAENRIEPYWKQSFTGYMQGASGIGSLLVRVAEREAAEGAGVTGAWKVRLPDQPLPRPA
jgi:lantibiotic modifying enzyme